MNMRDHPTLHSMCRCVVCCTSWFVLLSFSLTIILSALFRFTANRIGEVMVCELASSAVDREFEQRSGYGREVWSSIKDITRSRN